MNLSHYTAEPFEFDPARTYVQGSAHMKPRGLWLSVDGEYGWPEWCRDEDFRTATLEHRTPFTLVEASAVLRLGSVEEIRGFTDEFGEHPVSGGKSRWIDWERVADRYDGLLITPYQWGARWDIETIWYHGWDCASGCIWNLSAITPADVREVTP